MNNIPLPKSNKKEDIDTTIIAIKKQLEQINNILGLTNGNEEELPEDLLRRSDVVNVVEEDNGNPVSSGAVYDAMGGLPQPVDAVEYGNMNAVTSNAVSVSQSYINSEVATGEKFYTNAGIEHNVFSRQLYLNLDTYSDNGNRRMFMTEFTISSSAKIILEATGYVLFDKPTTTTGYQRRTTLGSVILGQDLMPTFASAVYFEQSTHKVHVRVYLDKRTYTPTEIQGYVRVKYTKLAS